MFLDDFLSSLNKLESKSLILIMSLNTFFPFTSEINIEIFSDETKTINKRNFM